MIGAKAGEGREAEVYAWGDDAVVKLYRPGYLGHRAESVALANLDGHSVAPRLIDIVGCDGRPGLVLERLGGSDMLELLQRQPWPVLGLARALAKARLAVHGIQAPGDLPDLRQVLAARIEDAVLPPQLRAFALRVLGGLPTGDRLCHGDFHPAMFLSLPISMGCCCLDRVCSLPPGRRRKPGYESAVRILSVVRSVGQLGLQVARSCARTRSRTALNMASSSAGIPPSTCAVPWSRSVPQPAMSD